MPRNLVDTSSAEEADNRLVWDTPPGTLLRALQDLHMDEDVNEPRAFTAGKSYLVESMHPVANPPFVRVQNDFGEAHDMQADHLRRWFMRSL